MPFVSPKDDCPHVSSHVQVFDVIDENKIKEPCCNCKSTEENWMCLGCYRNFCSRYVNGHNHKHFETDHHAISISLSDLSFWCNLCESYIEDPILKKVSWEVHKAKFGHYPGELGADHEIENLLQQFDHIRIKEQEEKEQQELLKQLNAVKLQEEVSKQLSPRSEKIHAVADLINNDSTKNIIVLTGAGLSTAAGIPDFRTPGTGLYDNLQKYNLDDPTDIFTLSYFKKKPHAFFELTKDFISKDYKPTASHYFIKLLEDKNILLRNYTQNIDALEVKAKISADKLVQCHGSYDTATCLRCRESYKDINVVKEHLMRDKIDIPYCNKKEGCRGVIKPNVVFFGEDLPERFVSMVKPDCRKCDLMIVIGTSLTVYPVASIPGFVNSDCPRVLINMDLGGDFTKSSKFKNDYFLQGDINEIVLKMCDYLGWTQDLEKLIRQE
ncbi:NAD-dependent protein deacetylase sirtuin [Acrasis kona]|uniref:NAD-dependent protein deacetylase sirtuin n=1 Tax=Acrasis kona TaxID=1008807 RepID=A0AAW2ZFG4_9EUKA